MATGGKTKVKKKKKRQISTTIPLFILLPLCTQVLLLGTDGKAKTAGELPKAAPGEAFPH